MELVTNKFCSGICAQILMFNIIPNNKFSYVKLRLKILLQLQPKIALMTLISFIK